MVKVEDSRLVDFPKILDPRGNLSFLEESNHIPFDMERVYWIYDVPGGESRGGHAFKNNHEFVIALSGSFDLVLDDGVNKKTYILNRSYNGVYIPKMLWRSMTNFSTNAVALVLSSIDYNPDDYIRDFEEFKTLNK